MGKKDPKNKEESSLNRQLLKYSLAAGAALAMGQPADAEIVCSSPEGLVIDESRQSLEIDLDNDGQYDFRFSFSSFKTGPETLKSVNVAGINHNSNAFLGSFGAGYAPSVRVLSEGYTVSMAANPWFSYAYGALNGRLYFTTGTELDFGNFSGNRGCFGVKFQSRQHDPGGAIHFGWIEYEGSASGEPVGGEVIRWGYETEPYMAIPACECSSRGPTAQPPSSDSIPSLNPLGLLLLAGLILAAGGAAVSRRKRGAQK